MYCTEELDSLCVCPGGSLALEGFAQWTSGIAGLVVMGSITLFYNYMNF